MNHRLVKTPAPARPDLDAIIAKARTLPPMTPTQAEEQRRSFVSGNVALANPAVTRELVDEVAQAHVENAGRDPDSSAEMQAAPYIYLDMDGVLADFDAGAGAALGTDNTYKWEWTHGTKAFWDKLDADDEFFFKLPPMSDAMLLFGAVRHLRPIVLTALPKTNAEGVAAQKARWVKKYLGDDVAIITCLTSEKPNYCFAGDILVDDRNVNAAAWEARGGRYVLHTDARSSVEKLQKMGVI